MSEVGKSMTEVPSELRQLSDPSLHLDPYPAAVTARRFIPKPEQPFDCTTAARSIKWIITFPPMYATPTAIMPTPCQRYPSTTSIPPPRGTRSLLCTK